LIVLVAFLLAACTKKSHEEIIPITGIILNPSDAVLLVGKTLTLEAAVEPADATNQTVTWSTNNEAVATVSPSGDVFAVDVGTATITASADNGRFTATCTVTVEEEVVTVTGVTLSPSDFVLFVGKTLYLEAAVEPADATNKTVKWSTSDDRVATVNHAGEVTAVAPGTATITVTTDDGRFTATCTVTVAPNITMTTKAPYVYFDIFTEGADYLIIDWGDGKICEITGETSNSEGCFTHEYSIWTEHRISIVGDNIVYLDCEEIALTALDVSGATALKGLHCIHNELRTLDVSGATALTRLNCYHNILTDLNVSRNTALTDLYCLYNNLTALDLSGAVALTRLDCAQNRLTALDVSNNIALEYLFCDVNSLTVLDVSRNTKLEWLDCEYNLLTTSALNDLFGTLPTKFGIIGIGNNPGTQDCDRSIAKEKGWNVYATPFEAYTRTEKLNMHFLNNKPNKKERYDKD